MTTMNWHDTQALAPRALPQQYRSTLRRRRILDAALELLADHPIETITTALIAARAGVPVASVYGYFPNKMAVIAQLLREGMQDADLQIEELLPKAFDPETQSVHIDKIIDTMIDRFRSSPFRQRLLHAVRGNEMLSKLSRQADDRMKAIFTEYYLRMNPAQGRITAQAVAQTVVSTFRALQEGVIECNDPVLLAALVSEWRKIMKAYLVPSAG